MNELKHEQTIYRELISQNFVCVDCTMEQYYDIENKLSNILHLYSNKYKLYEYDDDICSKCVNKINNLHINESTYLISNTLFHCVAKIKDYVYNQKLHIAFNPNAIFNVYKFNNANIYYFENDEKIYHPYLIRSSLNRKESNYDNIENIIYSNNFKINNYEFILKHPSKISNNCKICNHKSKTWTYENKLNEIMCYECFDVLFFTNNITSKLIKQNMKCVNICDTSKYQYLDINIKSKIVNFLCCIKYNEIKIPKMILHYIFEHLLSILIIIKN
jgi:hypothetical protein